MERIRINDAEFEIETVGRGEPLVLIHGSIVGESFDSLVRQPALLDRFQVTHYHRRGFLGSAPHDGPCSVSQQAADARAIIDAVGGGRAHVAGHSYGGATAIQLALDSPGAVHTLALLEPPLPVPSAEAFFSQVGPVAALCEAGDKAGAVDAFLTIVLGPGYESRTREHLPAGWFERATADIDTFFAVELPALSEWQLTGELAGRISQPTLSVLGAESDQFFVEGDQLLQEWIPNVETFVLPGATHGLQFMNPAPLADAMAGFMARHPIA